MTTFDFKSYIPQALRTEAPLPTVTDRLDHALLGLVSETGEYTTEIKRIAIYGKSLDALAKDGVTTLRQHIAEEIGDTLWYAAIAADAMGMPASLQLDYPLSNDVLADLGQLKLVVKSNAWLIGQIASNIGSDTEAEIPGLLSGLIHNLNYLAALIGIPLQEIADDNIAKLKLRYPEAFTAEAAEARADKGGEDARNS